MAKLWADTPFQLLAMPGTPGGPTTSNQGLMDVATEMTNIHNALLRGLNAIYLQCPQVAEPSDVADFMLYVKAWGDLVHHHHHLEESILFPEIEKLAKEAGSAQGVMNVNVEQHHIFEAGLLRTVKYAKKVLEGSSEFKSAELRVLIDGFAPALTQHLHDEIRTLTSLHDLDGAKVKKHMDHQSDVGQRTADKNLVVPLMLGCVDRTLPGCAEFPQAPWFLPYLSAYVFSKKHKGTWRFNPSDPWGKPRPLQFL